MLHLPLADKILFAIIFVTMETDLSLVISAQFLFFFLGRTTSGSLVGAFVFELNGPYETPRGGAGSLVGAFVFE